MRKIREVLRLKFGCGKSNREISKSCGIGRCTVADYLLRASAARLSWPLPEELDDCALEKRLFPPVESIDTKRITPDWSQVHQELRRKDVTLALLWQEYKEKHPDGYQYSWFCIQYNLWLGKLDVVMRQHHRAGEKLFVDYAGQTVPIIDMATGDVRKAQVFVAVLGASNYMYAEATWSQSLIDWTSSHVRAFSFFGGVTEVVVPDNLKSGVKKACFYDPDINPTYHELAVHYDTVVLPARVRKPRDKAKVESGVLVVERWILARLRKHTFFSLAELNTEIRKLLDVVNSKPFKKIKGCRCSLFESLDKPALKPLPIKPYELAQWKKVTVGPDYHIEVDDHYYSVFHQLIRKQIEVRFTTKTVECFYRGKRVASHARSYKKGYQTTTIEHMPESHQKYMNWRPENFIRWAEKIGPQTSIVVKDILRSRPHPQLAYRNLLGMQRLGKSYTEKRLEAACHRAVVFGTISFRSIESILKNGLDAKPLPSPALTPPPVQHDNIRGAQYYETLH